MFVCYTFKVYGRQIQKGAIYIFRHFFKKRKQNTQPESARIARRAVKLARLAELYNVSLSENVVSIAKIPDWELDKISGGVSAIVGCPASIIPMFAGYSQTCAGCPYFARDHTDTQNGCALKES